MRRNRWRYSSVGNLFENRWKFLSYLLFIREQREEMRDI